MALGIDSLDATALAELVRIGEIHPRALLEEAIARIEDLDPSLGAVPVRLFDQAYEQIREGLPTGPFTGVPFLVKDLLATVANVPQTSGSRFVRGYVPTVDSELVARFRRAGLVIVGRTNTPELGLAPTTEPLLRAPTRNPWDVTRSPGGSSGGAGAAVAARMVPMAHGNDGGGSLRIPASCCGLFGMKPTRGRNPLGPSVGDVMHGLVVEHALTVSVRDSAALLDATRGMDVGAPYDAPYCMQPYVREVRTPPGVLRVAVSVRTIARTPVHPDCVTAVEDAARLLTDLGHTVFAREITVDDPERLSAGFVSLWAGGTAASLDGLARMLGHPPTPDDVEPMTWALYNLGRSTPLSAYLVAVADLQRVAREVQRGFADVDVWLTPTLAEPPVPIGTFAATGDDPMKGFRRGMLYAPFTPLWNVTGQPAMSVPLYWNAQGLPIGVQCIARFGDEATLFRLAAQLEAARPWAVRKPAVCAHGRASQL